MGISTITFTEILEVMAYNAPFTGAGGQSALVGAVVTPLGNKI